MPTSSLRLFRWDDLPALVNLIDAAADVDEAEERFTAETLRKEITEFNDPETDLFLALTPDNDIVGYAYRERREGEDRVWGFGWGTVHPDYRHQGIGARLLRAAEARFMERLGDEGDKAIFLQHFVNHKNVWETALVLAEGYKELRSSYRMKMPLDRPLNSAPLPEGFELRPFDPDQHAQVAYEVDQVSFMDGGGQPVKQPYDEWYEHYIEADDYHPALRLVAWDGTKAAAICFIQPWGPDDPGLAWIGRLGVLREYRGRGLGEALLRCSFVVCQQQGYQVAGLGVRADVPQAIRLYERAGMEIYTRFVHYRKVIRGDETTLQS